MKPTKSSVLIGALVFVLSTSSLAQQASQDWIDIKDPQELRALYSNKTFRGTGWVAHYRADGKGILIVQGGKPVPRTWAVRGNDQVCATPEGGATNCLRFQRHRVNRNQVAYISVKDGTTRQFTVEDGIPNF